MSPGTCLGVTSAGCDLGHILTIGSGHLNAVLTSKPENIDRKVGVVSGQVLSWAVCGEISCLAIFRNSHKISWRSLPDQRVWLFPVTVLLRWFVQKPVHSTPSSDLPSLSSFIVPLSWENFSSTLLSWEILLSFLPPLLQILFFSFLSQWIFVTPAAWIISHGKSSTL